jgi:hypothetical protein
MRKCTKLLFAGLTAALLLSVAVSSASANNISVTNTRARITWSALRFLDETGAPRVTCPVTLEGSFHSATLRKIRGTLIGYVTGAAVKGNSCTGGSATLLRESLPWHITYDSFSGTLPNITGITLLLHNTAIQVETALTGACLYAADATHRSRGTLNLSGGGGGTTITPDISATVLRKSGGILCPTQESYDGTGQVFLLGNTSRISVTLI